MFYRKDVDWSVTATWVDTYILKPKINLVSILECTINILGNQLLRAGVYQQRHQTLTSAIDIIGKYQSGYGNANFIACVFRLYANFYHEPK